MRVQPLVVGLLSAVVATALSPGVVALPGGVPMEAQAPGEPFGPPDDWMTAGFVMPDDLPVGIPSNTVFIGGFCFVSSYVGMFCASQLPVFDPPAWPENPTFVSEEAVQEMEDEEADDLGADESPTEELVAPPPHEVADSGATGPREPAPRDEVPPPEDGPPAVPMPVQASLPGVNWAIVAAAITLPWAIGLKVLATLLGLRRASRLGRDDGRPSLRGAVLEAVASDPGIRHSDLVARIGRGNGTVEHHVRNLLAEGRVTRVRGLGSTLYFPTGAVAEAQGRLHLALQGGTSRRMAQAIAQRPGRRLADVARDLGVSGATAHYQAGKLVRAGVLREQAGTGRRFSVTLEGAACLAALTVKAAAARVAPERALVPDVSSA